MSKTDESQGTVERRFVVVHLTGRCLASPWEKVVQKALAEAESRGEIRHHHLELQTVGDAVRRIRRASADAVIAPAGIQRILARRLEAVCPVFSADSLYKGGNLDRLQDDPGSHRTLFVATPGGAGAFSCGGRTGVFGFAGANRYGWRTATTLVQGVERLFGREGSLGDRVGIPAAGPFAVAIAELAVRLVVMAVKDVQYIDALGREAKDQAQKAMDKIAEDLKKQKKQSPDDEQGRDFLFLVKETVESAMLDEFWQALIAGRVPPEESDTRDEFLEWVRRQELGGRENWDLIQRGMPLPEDDETGFALIYWLWTQVSDGCGVNHKLLNYLLAHGAPIDPIGARRQVLYIGGSSDGPGGNLSLVVRG